MSRLPARIMELTDALPEGAPICPSALLHLGNCSANNQALSRQVRRGLLLRAHAWVGPKFPQEIEDELETVVLRLAAEDRKEFGSLRATRPAWLAQPVSMRLSHG